MEQLKTIAQNKIEELYSNGFVEKAIEEQMQKTISTVVSDLFGSWSDFSKTLKENLTKNLGIHFERVSLHTYNQIVSDIIQKQLENTVLETATESIKNTIDSTLQILGKREWKLSEIIAKFIESEAERSEEYSEITLHVERTTYRSIHIYFDIEPDKEKYKCAYQISLHEDGKMYSFETNNFRGKEDKTNSIKNPVAGAFESFLFQLYAAKAIIEVDENHCETDYGWRD